MLSLDVQLKPKEAGTVVLNPSPIGKDSYVAGITVTIDVIPQPGWVVEEWIGPVFDISGATAYVKMEVSSKSLVVRLTQTRAAGSESPTPTLPPTPTPTPTPTPVPTPTPTPAPANSNGRTNACVDPYSSTNTHSDADTYPDPYSRHR